MLVVVYLVAAKKSIIIPQEWIMSLTQEALNNIGKASYQNRRIFWSNLRVDSDGIPDSTIAPDFTLKICSIFPPSENEVCYIARVKCFCANLQRAKYFRDTFRAQLPVLYNARREYEAMLPELLPPSSSHVQNTNDLNPSFAEELHIIEHETEQEASVEQSAGQSIDRNENDSEVGEEEQFEDSPVSLPTIGSNIVADVKCILPNIQLNEADSSEISHVFNYDEPNDIQIDGAQGHDTEDEAVVIETTYQEEGILKVKRVFDDDLEMIYPHGVQLVPQDAFYRVKLNDVISMHIPYKENVKGDRAYLLATKSGTKEVKLAAMIVNGLKQLNTADKRENVSFDKAFIKALLVGLIGVIGIKSQGVDKHVLKFIRELFQIRVGDEDKERFDLFNSLVDEAVRDIKSS